MDAVLDAATELFADRGPNAVTVRAIAQRAGINHALVHRYFGSKGELIRAVVQREQKHFAGLVNEGGPPGPTFQRMATELFARRSYARFLARALLDGYMPEQLQVDVPLMRALVGLAAAGAGASPDDDASDIVATRIAAMASLALGWQIFGDYLAAGLGLDQHASGELDARLVAVITAVLLAPTAHPAPDGGEA
jgi:AcrR family transcriptional regulator